MKALLICPKCFAKHFTFWGRYTRKLRPSYEEIEIKRVLCSDCLKTHSILPTFILEKTQHTIEVVSKYVDDFIEKPMTVSELRANIYPTSGAPEDISTLYRWFKRIVVQCKCLLPMLKNKLMQLAPQTNLKELEKIILEKDINSDHHICKITWFISEKLLEVSNELLPTESSLTTFAFLNYFCWQKTGRSILAPLPCDPD